MALLPPDPLFCFRSNMGHVHSICFADNEENCTDTLLAAAEDGTVYFWDLERNRLKYKQPMGTSIQAIHSIGDKIVTQEKEGTVKLWTLQDSRYVSKKTYTCASGFCKGVLFDDKLILPQENCTLDVIDSETMELTKRFKAEKDNLGQIMCVQRITINDQTYLLAGFESGDILLWDYVTEKTVSHIKLRECITSITFDTVNLRGICGNASNLLQIFSIDKSFNIALKCEITITNEGCNVVKLREDRKIFVSGGWDGRLRLFSWKSLRLLAVLTEHREGITDVQFSKKEVGLWGSKVLAASSSDGIISLWSLYN